MKPVVFAVPGDLATPTGGYSYDRRMIAELTALGWQAQVIDLGDGFPYPTTTVRAAAVAKLAALPGGQTIVIDGLAFGVLPDAAAVLKRVHDLIALVHHPLALESGLNAAEYADLQASERAALASAHRVIATSRSTARLLANDYAVPFERITVVRPGVDRIESAPRQTEGALALLAVGAIVPRKGYDVLLAALERLVDLPWRLTIAGDRMRSPETTLQLEDDIARLGLGDRITLRGVVSPEELSALYAGADLFVLPSRFEGYGMAFAEAISHGVPVVGTTAGAIPETVPLAAGILVPPESANMLSRTLRRLIENPEEREKMAAGARAAAGSFPTWTESAKILAQVLDDVA
jgi:glycosyltransferase involved in cell wall biosynthesis